MTAMRRQDRVLGAEEALQFLKQGHVGYLGLVDGDEPYVIPLNYLWADNTIVFHCALEGRKLDIIRSNPQCCFTVSSMDELKTGPSACDFGAYFHSVMVVGQARLIEDEEQKMCLLTELTEKYCPPHISFTPVTVERMRATAVVAISMDRISGKARRK
jgi:nitroimidazol reductase NimA-like FMN-containing flavoprotein (pyridoxamine 5'-phosphate oxidase superfamily)